MIAPSNSTLAYYRSSQAQMGALRQISERLQGQLATGERLSRSSEDPLAAAQLRALARQDRLGEVDAANARRVAEDLAQTGDTLDAVAADLIRARELTLYAANGALGDAERRLIASEIDELRLGLLASANVRDSGGNALFGGEAAGAAYAIDAGGNAVYVGSGDVPVLDMGQGQSLARGFVGPEVFGLPGAATDVFAHLALLSAALGGASPDPQQAARDALAGIDEALGSVARTQTLAGARLAWLDVVQQRQVDQSLTRAQQSNDAGGVDFAATVAELQLALTALEASQASFARVSRLSLFDQI